MSRSVQCLCVLFVLILPVIIPAQIWVARYNGPVDSIDVAKAITVDDAGFLYVTGWSIGSGSGNDFATVKYDSAGVEQWVARYNGLANSTDGAEAIAIDDASAVYVTGRSEGLGTHSDFATVKYDSAGFQQWVVRYDGPANSTDGAKAVAIDDAGDIYVSGQSEGLGTDFDYATLKYNSAGDQQWVRRYNGSSNGEDEATAMAVDERCNIYVTGLSFVSSIDFDFVTVKYDSAGVEQWVAPYNGPSGGWDFAWAIAVDDGGIYVTGPSEGLGTNFDYATVKYDSAGVQQWEVRYNGPSYGDDLSTAIVVDDAGFLYVTGGSFGSSTDFDFVTVKYDSAGVEQWVALYDGPAHGEDAANAIALDDAGGIYVTGPSEGLGTDFDYATVKYDSAGDQQWVARYDGPANGQDGARAIVVNDWGAIYVTGESIGSGTQYDYATIKYLPTGIEQQEIISVRNNYLGVTIFSGPLLLPEGKKCKVFDITGRAVEADKIQPGIYFIEIEGVVTQKVVKIR